MSSDTSVIFNLLARDRASAVVRSTAKKIGTAAAAAGAAGGAALAAGMVGNLENEAVNDKVAASLGLTPAQQKTSAEAASKIFAGAYADNMGEAANAVGVVESSIKGMRDASKDALADTTTTALNFSKTMDIDVADSVSTVGVLLETGLAKSAEHGFDLITAASQKVPAAMRADMLEAANEYSKHLAALGLNGQQAFGVLATAASGGAIALDKTGDALKEFQIRSTDMSTTSVAAYKAIGLNAHDMSNAILAGGDAAGGATQKIAKGLLSIKDPSKRAQQAIALFGTPIEDLGVDKIPAFLESLAGTGPALDNVAGASDRLGATLNDNGKARVDAMKNSVQVWTQSLTAADGPLGTVSAGVTAFGGTAMAGGTQLGMMALALRGTAAASMLTGAATGVASVGLRGVGIAARFAVSSFGIWITVAALVIAGLIYAYQHSAKFRAIVQGAMHGAAAAFRWLWSAAKAVFGWLKSNWPLILAILTGPIGMAVLVIHRKFDSIVGFIRGMKGKISSAARGMWGGITAAFRGAINAIIGGWNRIHFGIPGFNVGPIHYGGFQLGVPSIPYLAKGGIVPATPGGRMIVAGEGGLDEAIVPLGRGGGGLLGGGGRTVLEFAPGANGKVEAFIVELIRRFVRERGGGNVQAALGKG